MAVSWVKDIDFGNLSLVKIIYDIRSKLNLLRNAWVCFTPRSANSLADGLAKRGLDLAGEDVESSEF